MMVVAGILLLSAGVIFPLAFLIWLSSRLGRQPLLRPRQVGMWLAFDFVLSIGFVLVGLRYISPQLAASTVIRDAGTATLIAAGALGIGMAVESALGRRPRQERPHSTGDRHDD